MFSVVFIKNDVEIWEGKKGALQLLIVGGGGGLGSLSKKAVRGDMTLETFKVLKGW